MISILLLIGGFFSLLASFGMLRLPDVFSRSHAATKSATLGVLSLLSAAFWHFFFDHHIISGKILLGFYFVFITAPVAGHMISRAAYITGVPLWEKSVRDDLRPVYKTRKVRARE